MWSERNKISYGENFIRMLILKKFIDKGIRNKLSLLRLKKVKGKEESF